jgi:hypothetical protein
MQVPQCPTCTQNIRSRLDYYSTRTFTLRWSWDLPFRTGRFAGIHLAQFSTSRLAQLKCAIDHLGMSKTWAPHFLTLQTTISPIKSFQKSVDGFESSRTIPSHRISSHLIQMMSMNEMMIIDDPQVLVNLRCSECVKGSPNGLLATAPNSKLLMWSAAGTARETGAEAGRLRKNAWMALIPRASVPSSLILKNVHGNSCHCY